MRKNWVPVLVLYTQLLLANQLIYHVVCHLTDHQGNIYMLNLVLMTLTSKNEVISEYSVQRNHNQRSMYLIKCIMRSGCTIQ